MAVNYTVCVDNEATTTSVDMSVATNNHSYSYTDSYGCDVLEVKRTATFTCSEPSDEAFTIYYTYLESKMVDFEVEYTDLTRTASVQMPAGVTTFTTDVLYTKRVICPYEFDGSAPR